MHYYIVMGSFVVTVIRSLDRSMKSIAVGTRCFVSASSGRQYACASARTVAAVVQSSGVMVVHVSSSVLTCVRT